MTVDTARKGGGVMSDLTTELEAIEASGGDLARNLLPRIISTLREQAGEIETVRRDLETEARATQSLSSDLQAAREECERWSANYTELERDAGQLRAEIEQLKKERDEARDSERESNEMYRRARDRADAARAEAERMRADLATPCDTEVTWHNNGRGPRVRFALGREDYVVTAERAKALGAALLRTAIEALAASADKEGK